MCRLAPTSARSARFLGIAWSGLLRCARLLRGGGRGRAAAGGNTPPQPFLNFVDVDIEKDAHVFVQPFAKRLLADVATTSTGAMVSACILVPIALMVTTSVCRSLACLLGRRRPWPKRGARRYTCHCQISHCLQPLTFSGMIRGLHDKDAITPPLEDAVRLAS